MLTHDTSQGHYWEVYALNGDDDLTAGSTGKTKFETRVLNAISGSGTQDSLTTGDGVTWSNYNDKDDNARLFITTPAVDTWRGSALDGNGPKTWKYQNKVKSMITLVQDNIAGVAVQVVPYKRLNYNTNGGNPTGPDASIVRKNARGMAYFSKYLYLINMKVLINPNHLDIGRYDGTTSGKYWRLFYEYNIFQRGDDTA
jgi:hypothetical protein